MKSKLVVLEINFRVLHPVLFWNHIAALMIIDNINIKNFNPLPPIHSLMLVFFTDFTAVHQPCSSTVDWILGVVFEWSITMMYTLRPFYPLYFYFTFIVFQTSTDTWFSYLNTSLNEFSSFISLRYIKSKLLDLAYLYHKSWGLKGYLWFKCLPQIRPAESP